MAEETIVRTGDVMFDTMRMFSDKAAQRSDVLSRLALEQKSYLLATVHRAENTDDHERLRAIMQGLDDIARDLKVVLPAHPRTRKAVAAAGLACARVTMIDPVGYLDMAQLIRNSRLVATDSGGLQKEAYFHRVACVTLREETEWTELVAAGWNEIVPPRAPASVARAIRAALQRALPAAAPAFYGSGHAAEIIATKLTACPRKSIS
jgi:UDP-GlcNAc3NAcA epimerase